MVLFINYRVMCTFAYLLHCTKYKGLSSSMEFSLYFLRHQTKYTWKAGMGTMGALCGKKSENPQISGRFLTRPSPRRSVMISVDQKGEKCWHSKQAYLAFMIYLHFLQNCPPRRLTIHTSRVYIKKHFDGKELRRFSLNTPLSSNVKWTCQILSRCIYMCKKYKT